MADDIDIHSLTDQAWQFVATNQLQEAANLFSRLCRLDAANPEPWMMLGSIQREIGKLNEAKPCLEQAIALDPGYADAYLNLALLEQAQGNHKLALAHGKKAVECDAQFAEAWIALGKIQVQLGDYNNAAISSRHALKLASANADALYTLGIAYTALGQYDDAITAYQSAITIQPNLPGLALSLGAALTNACKYQESEKWLTMAIAQQPLSIEANTALGNLFFRQKRFEEAIQKYNYILTLEPSHAESHNTLGNIYIAKNLFKEAENHYNLAIQINENHAEALANLGLIYHTKGNITKAITAYKKAVTLRPDIAEFHYKLASGLESNGEFEAAIESCKTALSIKPDYTSAIVAQAAIHEKSGDFGTAYKLLISIHEKIENDSHAQLILSILESRKKQYSQAIARLNRVSAQPDLTNRELQQIHHALGKLYDQTEQYDKAFLNYKHANSLKQSYFEPQRHEQYIDNIIKIFTPELMHKNESSNRSDLPIFILGMPRSGTSLVEQILASHPDIHGAGELELINNISEKLYPKNSISNNDINCARNITTSMLSDFADAYISHLRTLNGNTLRITDKMPHNFIHLGLIKLLFPHAHIIHITRDPLDTCLSAYFQNFSPAHSYAYNLNHLGIYYRQYLRLMRHWKNTLNISFLEINYENLVADQENASREIINFCGLEWDNKCLKFYDKKRYVTTPSYDQVRKPIYNKSIARWKNYEKHLDELRTILNSNNNL